MAAQLSQNAIPNLDQVAAKLRDLISQIPQKLSVLHTTIQAMKMAAEQSQDHIGGKQIYWPEVMEALDEITPSVPQVEAQLEAIFNDLMALRETAATAPSTGSDAGNKQGTSRRREGMATLAVQAG